MNAHSLKQSETCIYQQDADLNCKHRVMNSWQRHKATVNLEIIPHLSDDMFFTSVSPISYDSAPGEVVPNGCDIIRYSTGLSSNCLPSHHRNLEASLFLTSTRICINISLTSAASAIGCFRN